MVGDTPGPIGSPVKYQITMMRIQASEINKQYGVIKPSADLMVYGLFLFKL